MTRLQIIGAAVAVLAIALITIWRPNKQPPRLSATGQGRMKLDFLAQSRRDKAKRSAVRIALGRAGAAVSPNLYETSFVDQLANCGALAAEFGRMCSRVG